jgi:hypothetical protein
MDRDERYFELLLSEKEHADSAIVGYADLHVKLFGFFGAGIVLLGWLYSEKGGSGHPSPTTAGMVCVALAVISCGIVVHGLSTYGLTLGYIQYKNEVLNPAFQELLALREPPLKAVTAWQNGAARTSITISSLFIFVQHKIVAIALLVVATRSFPGDTWEIAALATAWCVLAFCVIVEFISYRAIVRVLLHGSI